MIPYTAYSSCFRHLVLVVGLLLHLSAALEVVPSSSCGSICLDNPQNPSSSGTYGYDLSCSDSQYNTTTNGTRFQSCIDCQMNSAAVDKATGQTDLGWSLYNLKYAIDWCMFGYPDNSNAPSTPCDISCTSIQKALKANLSEPSHNTPYGYCQDGSFMAGVDLCSSCYALVDNHAYLSNFMRVLKAGCQQQPQPGARLGISGSVFSSTPIVSTSSSASPSTTPNPSGQWGLSAGAKVGIGLGVPAALLIILLLFGCWYQRKRDLRKRHHGMNERWGDKSITSPVPGWTQYRPDPERPMPQNESPHDYDQAQYASDMPKHGNGGGHHEKLVLQEIPLPRHKSPPPAMTVDTRNVPRGHGWEDPSPQSLFG